MSIHVHTPAGDTAIIPTRRSGPGPRRASYSWALGVVVLVATAYGLLVGYRFSPGVRSDFVETMRGQDLLTLLTVPALLACGHRARRGSLVAHMVWLGLLLYYAYTYVIYAFAPFNDVLLYVAVIGTASYGLLDGLVRIDLRAVAPAVIGVPHRLLAGFLIAVAALFLALWMAMILPAVVGDGLPDGRVTYDIPSAVHVLDLAFVLPLLVVAGVMLLRRHPQERSSAWSC